MSGDDRLAALRQQLARLDEQPLASHPEVLEQSHRTLVEELESLEDLDAGDTQQAGADGETHDAGEEADDGG